MTQRSGGAGIAGLLGLVAVFLLLRKFVPSLAKLFLILGGIALLGAAILVGLVLFFAFRKPPKTAKQQIAENTAAILKQGRTQLMDIRRLAVKIRHPEIRSVSESICSTVEKILRTLKEQPEDIPRVGRFFYYYLPTLQSILTKYTRLETHGIPTDDTAAKTLSCLHDMASAMEKQHLNLFEDDKLDLSAEMTVLTQICKRDGLLADDCQIPEPSAAASSGETLNAFRDESEQENGITLTL